MQETSVEAYASLSRGTTKKMRSAVFQLIVDAGNFGATLEEISNMTQIKLQTVCARRNELGKNKLVVDSGTRRKTSSGRTAIVWVVPPYIRKRYLLKLSSS